MLESEKYYLKLQKKFSRRINLDLKRINNFLKKQSIDPDKIKGKIVNIIGSDGKNAVLQTLSTIFRENKYKISTFTSPSIISPLDRIFIKNKFITLNDFKKFGDFVIKSREKLTLFEVLTIIYILKINSVKNLDFHFVESGAGFEKDSTNLWEKPAFQVITNINLQHLDLFGARNIEDICKIKVGSLSRDTQIYVGKQKKSVLKIIKRILKDNPSPVHYYGKDFFLKKRKNKYIYKDKNGELALVSKNIKSEGLWENVCLGIKIARDYNINSKIILKSIAKIRMLGRIDYINKGKLRNHLNSNEILIIDGAHSIKAAQNLSEHLKEHNEPIYGILGIQKNRHPEKFISIFKKNNFKKIVTVKIPSLPNSVEADKLYKICKKKGFNALKANSIIGALKKISSKDTKIICIFGSLYLASAFLKKNFNQYEV